MRTSVQKFTAWSYSRLRDYEQCAYQAKLKHLAKLPLPPGAAMARGAEVHDHLRDVALGKARLAKEFGTLKPLFEAIKKAAKRSKAKPLVERDWAVNATWRETGWFASDAWLRVKLDLALLDPDPAEPVLYLYDWKTGKYREENREQLGLYAVVAFAIFPEITAVVSALVYVDADGYRDAVTFKRDEDEKRLRAGWAKRVKPMLADGRFAPKPGPYCRWCPFSAASGGPCKF